MDNNNDLTNEEIIELEIETDDNNNLTIEEVTKLESLIIDERERAIREENSIRNNIDSEISRAIDAETILSENINKLNSDNENIKNIIDEEVVRATETEELIRIDLNQETQRATAAEENLENELNEFKTSTNQSLAELSVSMTELDSNVSDLKKSDILIKEEITSLQNNLANESNNIRTLEEKTNENITSIKTSISNLEEQTHSISNEYVKKSDFENKVDKKEGYSLISDAELLRLSKIENYDDTQIRNDIQHLEETKQEKDNYALKSEIPIIPTKVSEFENDSKFINKNVDDLANYTKSTEIDTMLLNKVDKVLGKSLIADSEIIRLSTVENYDDSEIRNEIVHLEDTKQEKGDYALKSEIPSALSELTNDAGFINKDVDNLTNYPKINDINLTLLSKVDKKEGYSLIADSEIERLANLSNYDDTEIKADILDLSINKASVDNIYTIPQINKLLENKISNEDLQNALSSKVNAEEGKGLSSNDFTAEEKLKLQTIQQGAEKNLVTSVNGMTGDVVIATSTSSSSSSNTSNGSAYPNFCVNSGSVDEYGEPNFIIQEEDTITAKAPFVYTTSNGTTHEVRNDLSLSTLGYSNGRYNLFVNKANDFELLLIDNEIHYSKVPPADIESNDIWVDISVYPKKAYIYTGISYKYCEYVPIGSIDVGITSEDITPELPDYPEYATEFNLKITNMIDCPEYTSLTVRLRVVKDGVVTYTNEIFTPDSKKRTYPAGTTVSIEEIISYQTSEYDKTNSTAGLYFSTLNEKYTYGRGIRQNTILHLYVVSNEPIVYPAENEIKITFLNADDTLDEFSKIQFDISCLFKGLLGTKNIKQWVLKDYPYLFNGEAIKMWLYNSSGKFETVNGYNQDTAYIHVYEDEELTKLQSEPITESITLYVKVTKKINEETTSPTDVYISEEEPSL